MEENLKKLRLAEIRTLITGGKSNGYIMRMFGMTIGQIAGIRHRMQPKESEKTRSPVVTPAPVLRHKSTPAALPALEEHKKHRLRVKIERPQTGPRHCTLLELKSDDCRWVQDDKLFCADEVVPGSSYCRVHHKIVYTAPVHRFTGYHRR